ncbi:lipase 5 [Colletotrichum melonis]|uniref:Lipase 5 n=2 Tax=Colletotrichum acutatum species complex TaxID=2707335 RepID=A0AAI9XK72_9PEZI|nr:lipase 5 [Colletotrichum tamarilloi]KAK1452547.1 lipase 5 [Colletotrichum melonis]KAK1472912.1 lipase 5 [Colletotrichum tamarilloi]
MHFMTFSTLLSAVQLVTALATVPPSEDPFYMVPLDIEASPPGAVLRIRTDPSNVTSVLNCSAAYNILYRTTDAGLRASWAVTTLLIPHHEVLATTNGTHVARLLSYQIPYNTADPDASPSHLLSTLYATAASPAPADYIAHALARGWYVSVPDFEGPNAAFFAGPQSGFAVLDSIRAVLSQSKLACWTDARYTMWGYSGGSFASFWAAELQASYAPDVKFVGMAIGGMPSNVTHALQQLSGTAAAGFVPSILLGVTAPFPEARQYIVKSLKTEGPFNATSFLACLRYNFLEYSTAYAGQDMYKYFANGRDVLNAPIIAHLLGNNVLPTYHGIPQMPIYAYKAVQDELLPVQYTDAHMQRYCEASVDVLYQRNSIGNHEEELANGAPEAVKWITRWLNGDTTEVIKGCTVQDVAVNITQALAYR